ncbi:MAG: methylenetetrahydrofolate--tRNA-(uracil(54)-C(5))-methyltransferase (FADH(2)-oxidizing) TrmFO [Bdellovibrionales bacterium GWA2_49_15]|nr:MAG: methylenetetrahydrofolate--tRNA-(uracil(54)-C(5))-methyltransferase (FADH(2)-oxidizing) TrmFO [Bdellovibrionales bacterium GWA2_49_15]HAZ11782.1 methylenetetrahydrofolate--tRNA-(uracil(54)-C(5))-methyltransferase (FADH(2)-oxidizing) TrmFO [Bdellovibrionales bacterium]
MSHLDNTSLFLPRVLVIGAGLAGCEAAHYLAVRGLHVVLADGKKGKLGPAQKISALAELVCTNSLKSIDPSTGHGLLKQEMQSLNSLILKAAYLHRVPAGQALAVDREKFSGLIQETVLSHPLIRFVDAEISDPLEAMRALECQRVIIATGPLTSGPLAQWITQNISGDDFYFYDAIAPVVDGDSLEMDKLYLKDRYGTVGVGDYLNAPMTKEEYVAFVEALTLAEKTPAKNFEELKYFEGCLPIDTMAARGPETLRFSCMKPVGLEKSDGKRPYAVVQLRQENLLGSAYNLVGFQTRLTHKEQVRIFRMIPGFAKANFLHLGSCHRNSYLNARKLLNKDFSCQKDPVIFFAGQLTGVEGYTESAAMGLYTAIQVFEQMNGRAPIVFPPECAMGALVNYVMTAERPSPSNINFGLFPAPVEGEMDVCTKRPGRSVRKDMKKEHIRQRAQASFKKVLESLPG